MKKEKAIICQTGFHACEHPLDCFNYYAPSKSVFCEVEQSGIISKHGDDTKVASSKIKIGAKVSIAGLVKAAIEFTKSKTIKESGSTGYKGASSSENPTAVAVAWGYESKAKGVKGSYIVCAEWKQNADFTWSLIGAKMVQVDGKIIKEDTYYQLINGEFVEVD